MIPLIIDDKDLWALRDFALAHPLCLAESVKMLNGEAPCAGDREGYSLDIPIGYRVVFSLEQMPIRSGSGSMWLKRMSMSQAIAGRVPNIAAVRMVIKALGFPPIDECAIDLVGEVVVVAAEHTDKV